MQKTFEMTSCVPSGNSNKKFNYEALIRKVKLYPAVFDSKHEMHKNRAYVNELWRQIAESLHSTDAVCREKWANLRSNYMRETRKLRLRRIEGKPLKVTWSYFHLLEFLDPSLHRKVLALTSETNDEGRLVIDLKPEVTCQDLDVDELTSTERSTSANIYERVPNRAEQDIYRNNNSGVKKKKITAARRDNAFNQDLLHRLIQEIREMSDAYSINVDKDRLFLLSLLPFMKQLSTQENLTFRLEIQHILQQKFSTKSASNYSIDATDG